MPSVHAPSEVPEARVLDRQNIVVVGAGGETRREVQALLAGARHGILAADAGTAAAHVRASDAGSPACVILVHEPPIVDAFDIIAAWVHEGLHQRCAVIVVAEGRAARRAALRAGALACVDKASLTKPSLIEAIEDALDRFTFAGGAGARPNTWTEPVDQEVMWKRIEERMGVCPAFFKTSIHEPAMAGGLFGLAEFAYLDNPIPALLKVQLYAYLSRFCRVSYCLALHCGFLLGRGHMVDMAGARDIEPLGPLGIDGTRRLLDEPAPSPDALARSLLALEQAPAPIDAWPEWDTELGYHLRVACTQVFLHSDRAPRWLFALQRVLGRARHEQLMLFLSFIRTAHFWTEVHPELEVEPDLKQLLHEDEALAASLASSQHVVADHFGPSGWVQAELSELRQRVEHAKQLRQLADAVPAYIAYIDAQRRFAFVNQSYVEHFQRPTKDIVGRPVAELWGEDNYRNLSPSLDSALAGERVRLEETVVTSIGGARQLDTSYIPDRRADGSIAGCFVLATDVTERKQVEGLTRRVLDKLFTFVVILDVDGTLIEANEVPLRMANLTIEDVRGKKFWDCFWWAHSPEVQVQLRDACERAAVGETVRCDVPVRGHAGGQMTMDFQVAPLRDHEGRITYLIPSAVDITNRARVEQQLRQSEERSSLAQQAGQVGIWEFDSATGATFWSDSMWAIYGRQPNPDLNPDDLFRVSLHPQDVARVKAWAAATLAGEDGLREVFRVVRPDRTIRWVESTATVTRAADAGSIRMVGVNIDITERKQAEQILRESEERLRIAKDAATLGIHDFDIRAGTLRWDERVRELWGLGPGEPITYETVISGIHPDDRAAMQAEFQRALDPQGDGSSLAEFRVKSRVNGVMRWAAATGQTTFEDGHAVRLVGTVQDVTARKQAEEALRQSQERLRETDRRKDEFLAMLGHELRNPLAAIRSASELLQLFASEDTRLDRVYNVLERQSNHMVRLIDGLLEVSRIARGKIHLERKAVDLREVLDGVVHDRSDQCARSGLKLHKDFPDEPVWVWGDDVRLAQIFDNLVGNAMKFTEAGGTISVGFWREGPSVIVRIKDTGVGIRPEMLSSIFEAFQQDTQGMARGAGGLGLGLALVKGLVELHEGSVEACSEGLGCGALFQVRLPISAAEPGPGEGVVGEASGRSEPSGVQILAGVQNLPGADDREQAQQARPWRVLIVEDNEDAAQMLRELLQLRGHTVMIAESGSEALERLRTHGADVVLCDIGLPGMSGYEVAQTIRADPDLRDVRMVALTGYGQPEDRRRAAEAGFDDHLIKPINLEGLEQLLARLREA